MPQDVCFAMDTTTDASILTVGFCSKLMTLPSAINSITTHNGSKHIPKNCGCHTYYYSALNYLTYVGMQQPPHIVYFGDEFVLYIVYISFRRELATTISSSPSS